jgi:hypothetical protein
MNDFTKEELETFIDWGSVAHESGYYHAGNKLFAKLQSLIDNYCEHSDFELDDRHYACNNCAAIWQ